MDYKSFVLDYKKKYGKTPNQLKIEKLYEEYMTLNINNIKNVSQSLTFNDYIKNNDLQNVVKCINEKKPYTENTIYLSIKTNNFEIFNIVYNYVNKITKSDYEFAKNLPNINKDIMKLINDKYHQSIDKKLLNAINGKTKSTGGLNFSELKNEAIRMFGGNPETKKIISKMNRSELIIFIKDKLI